MVPAVVLSGPIRPRRTKNRSLAASPEPVIDGKLVADGGQEPDHRHRSGSIRSRWQRRVGGSIAINPQEVLINGKLPGETSLIVWQHGGGAWSTT